MRRLPHQGARHSTVDHGDASDGVFLLLQGCLGRALTSTSTCGCFLRVEQSFLRMISLLFSLSSLRTSSRANGSLPMNGSAYTYLGLKDFTLKKWGPNRPQGGPGRLAWANGPRPIRARFGRPFAPVGPYVFLHFTPSICTILMMLSSRPRWRFF
jgi:hypothetical protein